MRCKTPRFRVLLGLAHLACFLAPPAAAETAEAVLDRWAAALGGRDRLAAVRTLHRIATVETMGLRGTMEEWLTAEGYHHVQLDLAGLFSQTFIRTPEHYWIVDQNGHVRAEAGPDLKDEIRDIYLDTWSHLLPGRLSGDAELLGADPESGLRRVRIRPESGTETLVYIDPHTHLPTRWESRDESGQVTTMRALEWREIDGIRVLARIEQVEGPDDRVLMELQEITFNQPPPRGIFERPRDRSADARFASGGVARDIPLDIDGVHLFLPVRVNGALPLWFIFDTGAPVTCIDREAAAELGFELTGQFTGGGVGEEEVEVNLVRDASFALPGVEVTGQTVVALDLRSRLEARAGREVDGILGYDFISRFVIEIDYLNRRLHLTDPTGWTYTGEGTEIPIWFLDGKPVCQGSITPPGGRPIECVIRFDTGSGGTFTFNRPFIESHNLLSALPKRIESGGGFGIGGASRRVLGRIEAIGVGNLVLRQPTCAFSLDQKGIGANATHAGKLGGRILERFTVTFDYDRQRIFLEPNARFGAPFPGETCGLSVRTGGRGDWHTFTVVDVISGSPADRVGLQVGDVIVSADGAPAVELRLRDLLELFEMDDRRIHLTWRRGDEIVSRELHLRSMF